MPNYISKAGYMVENRPMCKVVSYSLRTPDPSEYPADKGAYYMTEDGEMAFDSKQRYCVTDLTLKFQEMGKSNGPLRIRFEGQLQIFCYVSYNELLFDLVPEETYLVQPDAMGCFSLTLHLVHGAETRPYFEQKKTSIMIGRMEIQNDRVKESFSLMGELRQGLTTVTDAQAYAFCKETTEYSLADHETALPFEEAANADVVEINQIKAEMDSIAPHCTIESVSFEEYALNIEEEGPNPEQCYFNKETVKAYCKGESCAAFMLGITMKNEGISFDQLIQWFTGSAQFSNKKKTYTFNLAPTFVTPIYPDEEGRFTFYLYFVYKKIAEDVQIARLDQTNLKVTLPQIHVVNQFAGEQFDLECVIADTIHEQMDPSSYVLTNREIVLKK